VKIELSFGTVTVRGAEHEFAVKRSGNVEILEFTFAAAGPVNIAWAIALNGVAGCWRSSNLFHKNLPADYQHFRSHVSAGVPAALFFDQLDRNLFAFNASEALREVSLTAGVNESDNWMHCSFDILYFPAGKPLLLRFDRRCKNFAEVLRDAFRWSGKMCAAPVAAPVAAFRALYSTWYSYHQDINAAVVETECRAAARYGIGTVIVDDGWHMAGTLDSYSHCGDWQVDEGKFPDFAAHVKRVQALKMKYMLWIALPFLGHNTKAFAKLKDCTLYQKKEWQLDILDPRCPEVRDYLADRLEELAVTYGIDGFKLDFIEQFKLPGGDEDGHLAQAVDLLLREITGRLRAVKPEMLIEFRRPYESAALRQYANMFRAGDCPADFHSNRVQTLDLRLMCPEAAIHSDMLTWGNHEQPDAAALQLLSVLFGVPQISVRLNEIPPAQRRMLKFWLGFFNQHRDTLLDGRLELHEPGLLYPYAVAQTKGEAIHLLAARDRVINVTSCKTHFLINAAGAQTLYLRSFEGPKEVEIRNAQGKIKNRFTSVSKELLIHVKMSDFITIKPKTKEIQ
jgi:alpha-galactosidase